MADVTEIGVCPRCGRPDPLFGPEKPTNPKDQCWRRLLLAGGSVFNADDSCRDAAAAGTTPAPGAQAMTHEEQLREALREVRYWFAANAMPVRAAREAILARIDAALSGKREGEGAAPQIEAGAEARGAGREFNLNDSVLVKVTEDGRRVYDEHWRALGLEPHTLRTDAEGWARFQLWDLMSVFGSSLYNGCRMPIETTIRLVRTIAAPEARDGKRCRVDLNDTGIGEPVECSEPMPCADHPDEARDGKPEE